MNGSALVEQVESLRSPSLVASIKNKDGKSWLIQAGMRHWTF